jgi:hypothetical protein
MQGRDCLLSLAVCSVTGVCPNMAVCPITGVPPIMAVCPAMAVSPIMALLDNKAATGNITNEPCR